MKKNNEEKTINELNIIYENLKSEILREMQISDKSISDICYDLQLTEEQFVSYFSDKSDVGFCVDVAKKLVKKQDNLKK